LVRESPTRKTGKNQLVGIPHDTAAHKSHRVRERVDLIQGDCFAHEFNEKVDFVHWNNSLHHMLDANKAVKSSYDILSPGGVFYMDDFAELQHTRGLVARPAPGYGSPLAQVGHALDQERLKKRGQPTF
jgi:SAM-dependent methyltransferase